MTITPAQNRRLHQLINSLGIASIKSELINDASNGRTNSSKELSNQEATYLIKHLESKQPVVKQKKDDPADRMRKKILSVCHQLHWHKGTDENGKAKLDWKRINDWCIKYSPEHKTLNEHTIPELTKLVTQFESVLKHQLNK
jgi:hypothetical protein